MIITLFWGKEWDLMFQYGINLLKINLERFKCFTYIIFVLKNKFIQSFIVPSSFHGNSFSFLQRKTWSESMSSNDRSQWMYPHQIRTTINTINCSKTKMFSSYGCEIAKVPINRVPLMPHICTQFIALYLVLFLFRIVWEHLQCMLKRFYSWEGDIYIYTHP